MTTKTSIDNFISCKNIAVLGVSRNQKKFGNYIYKELKLKGYNVFAINPFMDSYEGDKVYHSLDQLPSPADGAILSIPPVKAKEAVKEIAAKGIKNVWLQKGSSSKEVAGTCHELGLDYINNECIMMFLEPVESVHKFHRWFWKLIGKYPK